MDCIIDIKNRRGFDISEPSDSVSIILVKADVRDTSNALARLLRANVIQDIYKNSKVIDGSSVTLVWQYVGHDWSTILLGGAGRDDIAITLSKKLKTDCIYYSSEDVSGWEGYELFRNGVSFESYRFGVDYLDDLLEHDPESLAEIVEEMLEEPEYEGLCDIDTTDNNDMHQFLFRSKLRSVEEEEVRDSHTFLDYFLKSQNAWISDWKYMPSVNPDHSPNMEQSFFVGIDAVDSI